MVFYCTSLYFFEPEWQHEAVVLFGREGRVETQIVSSIEMVSESMRYSAVERPVPNVAAALNTQEVGRVWCIHNMSRELATCTWASIAAEPQESTGRCANTEVPLEPCCRRTETHSAPSESHAHVGCQMPWNVHWWSEATWNQTEGRPPRGGSSTALSRFEPIASTFSANKIWELNEFIS